MNDEAFNLSVRRFLKSFGLIGQHEIEQAAAGALARSAIAGQETLPGKITLEIPGLSLKSEFHGEIPLDQIDAPSAKRTFRTAAGPDYPTGSPVPVAAVFQCVPSRDR